MNAISPRGAEGFLARFHENQGRLPGDSTLRAAAADAFRRLGLPGVARGRRAEAWKYTSLQALGNMSFRSGSQGPILPDGFAHFADRPDFGELSWPDRDPMVALNTMLAEDGAVLTIAAGQDVGLVHLKQTCIDGTSSHPRHLIRLEAGARMTLIETSDGDGCYLYNPVSEIHVADGAVLTHVRIQTDSTESFHMATIYADVAGGGIYDSFTLNIGGRITRTEIHATLNGPGATAHMNGAQLLTGSQHADFTSVVRHAAPKGTSRQTVKNVLAGHSRGVFQGRIEVARDARGTDGYQMNRALLLSPDAEIDTKPELEIFASDVKCSHGATIGELDSEQIFYLRSRGVPDQEARAMLVRAFLSDALDPVTNETARDLLEANVTRWWEGQTR